MALPDHKMEEPVRERDIIQENDSQGSQRPQQPGQLLARGGRQAQSAHEAAPAPEAVSAMHSRIAGSLIRSPESSPFITRSRRIATRSLQRITSSSSEEMKRIAMPFSASETISFWISAF